MSYIHSRLVIVKVVPSISYENPIAPQCCYKYDVKQQPSSLLTTLRVDIPKRHNLPSWGDGEHKWTVRGFSVELL